MDSSTTSPGPYDVLCCKSNEAYEHIGNRSFRALVESHSSAYANVSHSKVLKSQVVNEIIVSIRSPGGRFLQREKVSGSVWTDVPKSRIREKVGHALRREVGKISKKTKTTDSLCCFATATTKQPQRFIVDEMISKKINQLYASQMKSLATAEHSMDPFKPIECFPPAKITSTSLSYDCSNDDDNDNRSDCYKMINTSLHDPFESTEPLEPLLLTDSDKKCNDEVVSLLKELIEI